ncbi:hypothetical protein MVEN_02291500 [Mycena venus]|uniref:Uncharacterized protein n=1 Tax=Mycena venus TaxID=2733690 RepID=A0A8H6X5B5_9AGAR|nr:hypothetical protein MVEN_02291500 [Mycena venus]
MAPQGLHPPWSGWIETTGDALLILEAAQRGLIPRVTRRLVDTERKMITSGSVFVFNEDESGIKRWTDGFFWSPSRILGNFLLYRETDKKGAGHGRRKKGAAGGDEDEEGAGGGGGESLSRPRSETKHTIDRHRERTLVGSLTNSYKFKADGLMKKTFSLTIAGVAQHLISYYKVSDVESGRLRAPSSLPELASLDISPTLLERGNFRCPPKTEVGFCFLRFVHLRVPRGRHRFCHSRLCGWFCVTLPAYLHPRPAPVYSQNTYENTYECSLVYGYEDTHVVSAFAYHTNVHGWTLLFPRPRSLSIAIGIDGVPRYRGEADEVLAAGLDLGLGVGVGGGRRLGPAPAPAARSSRLGNGSRASGATEDTDTDADADADGDETEDDYEERKEEQKQGPGEDVKVWARERVEDVKMKGKSVGRELAVGFSTLAAPAGPSRLGSKSASTSPIGADFPPTDPAPQPLKAKRTSPHMQTGVLASANRTLASAQSALGSTTPRTSTSPALSRARASTSPTLTKAPSTPALTSTPLPPPPSSYASTPPAGQYAPDFARGDEAPRTRAGGGWPAGEARKVGDDLTSGAGTNTGHGADAGTWTRPTASPLAPAAGPKRPPQYTHPPPLPPQQQQARTAPVHLHPLPAYPPASSSSSSLAAAAAAYSQQFAQGAGQKQQQQTGTGGPGVLVSRQGTTGGVPRQEGSSQAVPGGQTGQLGAGQPMGPLQPGQAPYHPYAYPWYYASLSSAWHPYAGTLASGSGQQAQPGSSSHHRQALHTQPRVSQARYEEGDANADIGDEPESEEGVDEAEDDDGGEDEEMEDEGDGG